jgi:DNA-binding NtrC family response regulator
MTAPVTILIADDEEYIRDDLTHVLGNSGYRLVTASTAAQTLQCVLDEQPDLVLLDLKFPDCDDLSLLKRIKDQAKNTEVIIVSSQSGNLSLVVQAIKNGAFDYIAKPFVPEELINRVEKALSLQALKRSQTYFINQLQEREGLDKLIGQSAAMNQVRDTIQKFADSDLCVLIRGETGTGKELAARALHCQGRRSSQPFVAINCASIPETLVESVFFGHKRGAFTGAVESVKGKFEAAGNGTIFLDEIGDMPLLQQTSLLRVLEYRKYSPVGSNEEKECRARFILATNRDLKESIRKGLFREDLYYRINVASISLPPLRSRLEDVECLTDYYCKRFAAEIGRNEIKVAPDVLTLFKQYDWPGNVRELRHVIEGSIMLADPEQNDLSFKELPPEILALRTDSKTTDPQLSAKQRDEKTKLIRALQESGGNQTQAAKLLGCHRNSVRAWVRFFGITDSNIE